MHTHNGYTITPESFHSLATCWPGLSHNLRWHPLFVLPDWLGVWWQVFGSGAELYLRAVRQEEKIIGVAPLLIKDKVISIIGSTDVCDYLDFIVVRGRERDFFSALLDDLKQKGVRQLDLRPLRSDSTVLTDLVDIAKEKQYNVLCQAEGVSVEIVLPATWDEYLASLTKKQRHEVKRKLRRLWEADNVDYHCLEVSQEMGDLTDTFLRLFSLSREEKANFMTAQMESFFRAIAKAMADLRLLRFGIIELDTQPAAMIMGFDYNDSMYLYNSAYDPRYDYLNVGLLCKALCIKESIQKGRTTFDFLKGEEPYKYRLGGQEIPLYNCQITIS